MKHRKNLQEEIVPEIVLHYESMLKAGQVGFLNSADFEKIVEFYEEEMLLPKAKEAIDLAINRYPFQVCFLLSKSSILLANGKIEEAEVIIDKAGILAPSEWEVTFRRAELCAMRGQFQNALSILDQLIDEKKEADFGMLYLLKGMVYQDMTDFRKMYDSLKLSLEADPTNEHALHLFWLSVEICQEHEESIEFHHWLIDQEPYSALAWSNLGHAYSCIEDWSKAAEAFEYAYIIDQEFEFAYRDCAIALIKLGQYKKALECLQEGMQFFQPEKDVLAQVGTCHIELGNFEEARIALLDGLSLDANSNQLHYLLGKLHNKKGNFQKALVYLNRAIQFDNPEAEYFVETARVYQKMAELFQADHYYQEACIFGQDNLDIHLEYAAFKREQFGEALALDFLKSIQPNFPNTAIKYYSIGIMLNMENRKKGLVNLARALDKNFNEHTTLLKYFPMLKKDAEVNAIIASFKPIA